MSGKKFFYGWVVVAALCIITAVPMVFCYNYFSFYQVPICTELGCSYVQFNLASAASTVAGMIFSLFFVTKFATGNTKLYMIVFGIVNGACWAGIGLMNSIWPIVFLYFVAGFCAVGAFTMAVNIVVPNWFVDRRGMAISLAFAGQGIGGAIFSPVMSSMIATMGWRTTIMVCGAICAVVYTLVCALLVKIRPSDMGLEPYRQDSASAKAEASETAAEWEGVSKADALKSPAFWALAGIMICCGFLAAGVITQYPTYLIELGVEYAPVMSVYALVTVAALVLMGPVFDKLGVLKGIFVEVILLIAAFAAILMVSQNAAMAFAGAVLFALGAAVTSLAPPLLTSSVFGSKDYAGIYGLANTFFMVGCMAGPLITSGIRSAIGSYAIAWVACIALCAVMLLLTFAAVAFGKKLRESKSQE